MSLLFFRKQCLACVLVLAGVASSLPAQAPAGGEKPAATVNGENIVMAEVKAILDQRPSPVPLTEVQQAEMRKAAINMLIDDAIMRQFLRQNAPPANPAEVNKELAELNEVLKKQNKTMTQFLKESSQNEQQLRQDIVARVQWKTFLKQRLPDAYLKKYYDENKVFFDKVMVQASHIFIRLDDKASAVDRQSAKMKLEVLRQEIVAGKLDFADAARKHSDCPSKEKGGDVGLFPYKFVVMEPFARAAFALKEGQLSDVVFSEAGMHLIKVVKRTEGEPSKFESITEIVREVCAQDLDLYQHLLQEQRQNAKIEMFMQ